MVLSVNKVLDLALLAYAALGVIYDMLIMFCGRNGCSDLPRPSLASLSSARTPLMTSKDRMPAERPNRMKVWYKNVVIPLELVLVVEIIC